MGASMKNVAFAALCVLLIAGASAYSSGSGTTSSGSASGTTTAQTATLKQKITFAIAASAYTGQVKTLAETAFGKTLSLWTTSGWVSGASVSSAVVTRRSSTKVEFTATMPKTLSAAAHTAAKAISKESFAATMQATKPALGSSYANVAVPTVSAIEAPACSTCSTTTSGAGSLSFSVATLVGALAVAIKMH